MSDELTKTIASLIGISTMAATARSILTEDRRSLKGFARATFLAIFVGGITGSITNNYNLSPQMSGAVVGLCAFVADDLLLVVITLAKWLRTDPSRILNIILNRKID